MAQNNSDVNKFKRMLDQVSLPTNDPVINFLKQRQGQSDKPFFDPAMNQSFQKTVSGVQKRAADTSANYELTNRITEGDTNLFGATLRILTGLGRGITNGAYDVMEKANVMFDRLNDGDVTAEDFFATAGDIITTPFAFAGGAARGIAGSAPGAEGAVQDLTGRPVIENWYELFKSPEFAKSVENLPALDIARSDKEIFGEGTWFTPSGVISTVLDIGLDPASFATLGLGGALRGVGQGIRGVSQASQRSVAAAKGVEGAIAPELGEYVVKNVYNRNIAKPEVGDALTALQGGRLGAINHVLKSAGSGFVDAHKRAIARIESRRALKGNKAALLNQAEDLVDAELEVVYGKIDEMAAENINRLASSAQKTADGNKAASEKILAEAEEAKATLARIWDEYPDPSPARTAAVAAARETAEEAAAPAARAMNPAIAAKLETENALSGTPRVESLVQRRKPMWLENPQEVATFAREIEQSVLNGEPLELQLDQLQKRFSPADFKALKELVENPLGYRERKARKTTATEEGATLGVTATGKQITEGDLRIVEQQIKGTKLSRTVDEFVSSKEGLRVMSLLSDLSKKVNKAGSKNTPGRSLNNTRSVEELFYTPQTFATIPPSVLYARVAFLAERAANTETEAFIELTDLMKNGYNPLTEMGQHPLPSSFPVFGKKEKYFLSEILEAGRTVSSQNYSQELIKTLEAAGVSVIKAVENGQPVLRTADEIQEILMQSMTRTAMAKAQRESKAIFAALKKQYPGLTEDTIETTLKPAELKALQEATSRAILLEEKTLERLLKELNPEEDVVGKARATLERAGIDWDGRGSAFQILSTGRMAFRDFGDIKSADLSVLKRILESGKPRKGEKVIAAPGTAVFGPVYNKLQKLVEQDGVDGSLREAAVNLSKFFKSLAATSEIQTPQLISATFAEAGNLLKQASTGSINASNNFLSLFKDAEGVVKNDWVIDTGIEAYKASIKKGSKDRGVFAATIDKRIQEVIRKDKATLAQVEKGTEAYMKLVRLALRDFYGPGLVWDGAGLTTWTALDVLRSTGKENMAALAEKPRKDLEANIPYMVERVKDRVWNYALREERLEFPREFDKRAFVSAVLEGKPIAGVKISPAEQDALVEGARDFIYGLGGEAGNAVKQLLAMPEVAPALNNFLKGLSRNKKGAIVLNAKQQESLIKLLKTSKNPEVLRMAKQIEVSFNNQFALSAKRLIEDKRKAATVDKALPDYAQPAALIASIKKSGSVAVTQVMMRLMLAESVMTADFAIKAVDRVAARSRATSVNLVAKGNKFNKILTSLEAKATKATGIKPIKPSDKSIAAATLDDFADGGKYGENPLMLIAKIRSFEVNGSKEAADEWESYLRLLLSTNLTTGTYRSLKDINAEALLTPQGRESLQRLADVLADAGDNKLFKTLERGSTPRLATVQASLDKLKGGVGLNPTELDEMMKPLSLADELDMASAKEVEEFAADLAPDQVIAEDFTAFIDTLLNNYQNAGQTHIPDLAALYTGAIAKRHIVWRSETIRQFRTKLDRVLDTNTTKKRVTDHQTEFAMLRTVEPQSVLTGSKVVYQKLSEIAAAKGLEGARRAKFMRETFEHIENLGEAQLKRLGMHFAFSVKETTGEMSLLKLYGEKSYAALKQSRPAAVKTVYLSTADVKQALPEELAERLFYMGKNESIPETAISGAVRLAVALRSELATGKEFTAELNDGLAGVMFDLIRGEIKTNTSLAKDGAKGLNVYNLNKDLMNNKIAEFVDAILEPTTLDTLVAAHIKNAAFTMKLGRKTVDQYLAPIIETAQKVFKNRALGSGDRIQAALNVHREFEKIYANRGVTEIAKKAARFDLHTFLVANMTKDDMNTFLAALYKDTKLTGEAAAIAKVQKDSVKNAVTVGQTALKIEADSFEQALDNSLGMNIVKAADEGTLSDDVVGEAATNHQASIGQALHHKKYQGAGLMEKALYAADAMLERLFFGYGADYITPLVNPAQRVIQEQVTTHTEQLAFLAEQLDSVGATREVRIKAFQLIKQIAKVDEELLGRAAEHHTLLQTAIAQGQKLTLEEGRVAADIIEELRPIFQEFGANVEDTAMLDAVTAISQHANYIFGGGIHNMVASAGLHPSYLNEMIAQVGGTGIVPEFVGRKAEDITSMWKEWPELDVDPLETIRLLHAGLRHAHILPMSAMTITKNVGVPTSAYNSLAEAEADGLTLLKGVDYPAQGSRLLYFLDTQSYYYPKHLIPEIRQAAKMLDETTRLASDMQWLQKLDPLQNRAKQFMTTLRPGNWVQNGLGGVTVNGFKGVWNPLRYSQATRMVRDNVVGGLAFVKQNNAVALRNSGLDVTKADEWGARYIKSKADEGYTVKPSSDIGSKKVSVIVNGRRVDYDEAQIMEMYRRQGGLVTSTAVFDPLDETLRVGRALKTGYFKKFTTGVGRWSANRDDVLRMALYLDIMKKEGGKNLEEASRSALREVNRVHPQMQDLSKFNQKWSKRTIMFFTWRAKTLGFLITEILDKPGAILAFQKAYTNTMLSQGLDVELGDLQPKNIPTRSYMEGNMNVMLPGADGGLYSMSLANPVNDLFGSQGWLSGISLNTYEPIENQVLGWGTSTFKNVFTSSDPLIISLLADWGFSQKTGQGTQFADSPDMVPLLVEDAFSRMGLKPLHTSLAYFMPDVFKRVSWQGETQENVDEASYLEFINWVGGLRIKQVDKYEDQKKAVQELLSKIEKYSQREAEQEKKNLGG
jgi:hypothetical protein